MDDLGSANSRLMKAIDVLRSKLNSSHGSLPLGVESAVVELETSSVQAKDAFRRQVFELEHLVLQLRSTVEVKNREASAHQQMVEQMRDQIRSLESENESIKRDLSNVLEERHHSTNEASEALKASNAKLIEKDNNLAAAKDVAKAVEEKLLLEIQTAYQEVENLKVELNRTRKVSKANEIRRIEALKQLEITKRELRSKDQQLSNKENRDHDTLAIQVKSTQDKVIEMGQSLESFLSGKLEKEISKVFEAQFDRLLKGAKESADNTVARVSDVISTSCSKQKHKLDDAMKVIGQRLESIDEGVLVTKSKVEDGLQNIDFSVSDTQKIINQLLEMSLLFQKNLKDLREQTSLVNSSLSESLSESVSHICDNLQQIQSRLSNGQDDSQTLKNIKSNLTQLDKENHSLEQENETLTEQTVALREENSRLLNDVRQLPSLEEQINSLQIEVRSQAAQLTEEKRSKEALKEKLERYKTRLVHYAQEEQRTMQQQKWEKLKEKEALKRDRILLERQMSGILKDIANQAKTTKVSNLSDLDYDSEASEVESISDIDQLHFMCSSQNAPENT